MILQVNNNKFKRVKEVDFKLEKDIQTLVENNLEELLSLRFVATEFSIEKFRFDSVAYDEDTNAFVIIEYKKGKNESLVDQGLSYLNTLLRRKADFVLLYNEACNQNKNLKDFDWSQTRVIFISPMFTTFQLNAALFKNIPFSFYEIKQFENGLIEFNEVGTDKESKADFDLMKNEPEEVKKEIKVFTEEDHLEKAGQPAKELYLLLKEKVLDQYELKIIPKQEYIAYKARTNVFDVTLRKNDLLIMINLQEGELEDKAELSRLMKKENGERIGHHGNGDYECKIKDEDELNYFLTLVSQSYKKNK